MAAGAGVRFGGGKLTSRFRGRMLIEYALDAVPADAVTGVFVIAGDPVILSLAEERGFVPVRNDRPDQGLSRTIRLGLEAAGACAGAMFLAADQPLLRRQSAERLLDAFRAHPDRIAALAHDGQRGNPCVFPARFFPELLALRGDTGGSAVILAHGGALQLVEVPARELADVDTVRELKALE